MIENCNHIYVGRDFDIAEKVQYFLDKEARDNNSLL